MTDRWTTLKKFVKDELDESHARCVEYRSYDPLNQGIKEHNRWAALKDVLAKKAELEG